MVRCEAGTACASISIVIEVSDLDDGDSVAGGRADARGALLAALAEPHRLAIADALALGDLAPTELADNMGLASNLLAHHLGWLERAGVIRRRRSDADGRRTYLTLAWDEPIVAAAVGRAQPGAGLQPLGNATIVAGGPATHTNPVATPARAEAHARAAGTAPRTPRVVFVCLANSARSQMAAALLDATGAARAASAGTQPAAAIHPLAVAELARRGLEPLAQVPAPASAVLTPDDLVVAVCDHAYETLGDAARLHWSVPDPATGGSDDFARAFDDLASRVGRLAAALTP